MPAGRLITLVLEVADLAASVRFYRDQLGLDLHSGADNHAPGDRWISGGHAALSWRDSFLHFSLYQSKGEVTRGAQLGFPTDDIAADHARLVAAGVPVIHAPRAEPWGQTSRYGDPDGNVVSLTQQTR